MSDALAYSQVLMQQEATVIVFGLVFVLAFQLVVFRWAERSYLVTATYLVATIVSVGGPFVAAVVETPNRVFNIYDREVLWTLLSFLMTIVGIAFSSPLRQLGSAVSRTSWPFDNAGEKAILHG